MTPRIVADLPDGSQVLVTLWATGEIEVASRPSTDQRVVWGAPASTGQGTVRVEVDQ